MSWYANYKATLAAPSVKSVKSVTDEIAEDDAAERAAIQAEPRMPPLGTPERERMDREQAAMVAGLLKAAAIRPPPCERAQDQWKNLSQNRIVGGRRAQRDEGSAR